ncbi:MAG TPA: LysM peptidoglycan-binding domain-containing protein, partial [Enterococcus sp.]|nr:LysM peptidoglycan-binding domain-containing protein [Enterococcus sp.]
IRLNGIQNNFIYPGQTLTVAKSGSSSANQSSQSSKPATPNKNTGSQGTYTVQSGDSVWLVANKHGMTMDELIRLNGIQNNFIYPGQTLTVSKGDSTSANQSSQPSQSTTPTTPTQPSVSQTNNNTDKYTVQSGESVWLIADKFGITIDELCSWNNIQNNFIYPGQTLIVKGNSTSANRSNQSTTPATPTTNINTNSNANETTYKVQSGDSVWLISDKFGITIDELSSWNNLENNFIYPGQTLKVA